TSYYFTVDELAAFDGEVEGRTFRVKGALVPDTFVREEGGTMATFALTAGDQTIPATYDGVVPDLFFNTHSEIILQGTFGVSETFNADTVSVLCPTKYQALEEVTT
ncbi:MAG: cytochrome c maturation protein CcmE, partial [Dehalococcoidia bacterium]